MQGNRIKSFCAENLPGTSEKTTLVMYYINFKILFANTLPAWQFEYYVNRKRNLTIG